MQFSTDARFHRLSPRQRECLRLVYERKRTKEIAILLGLSVGTVGTYCTEAIRILEARDRVDAAEQLHAFEEGCAPQGVQLEPVGVVERSNMTAEPGLPTPRNWRRLLPFRLSGAAHNDLSPLARLAWIPVLALIFAIGFAVLADTVRLASDIVAGRGSR